MSRKTIKLEPAFGFSNDLLGHVVNRFVIGMGRTKAMLRILENDGGEFDLVHEYLCEINGSFCQLFDHLITCGASSVENDFRSVWASKDGDTIKSEVAR